MLQIYSWQNNAIFYENWVDVIMQQKADEVLAFRKGFTFRTASLLISLHVKTYYFTLNCIMRWLLFVARVTFICNIFFILCLLYRHTHFPIPESLTSFVAVVGWILSLFANVSFALIIAICRLRKIDNGVESWLLVVNLVCCLVQIIYFAVTYL